MSEIKVEIDLNFHFTGLDGQFLKSNGQLLDPVNKLVANFLYNGFSPDKSDKLRNRTWAMDLFKSGKIEVSKKEIDAILEVCQRQGMADGVYCELQDVMERKKEEWDTKREQQKSAPKE